MSWIKNFGQTPWFTVNFFTKWDNIEMNGEPIPSSDGHILCVRGLDIAWRQGRSSAELAIGRSHSIPISSRILIFNIEEKKAGAAGESISSIIISFLEKEMAGRKARRRIRIRRPGEASFSSLTKRMASVNHATTFLETFQRSAEDKTTANNSHNLKSKRALVAADSSWGERCSRNINVFNTSLRIGKILNSVVSRSSLSGSRAVNSKRLTLREWLLSRRTSSSTGVPSIRQSLLKEYQH